MEFWELRGRDPAAFREKNSELGRNKSLAGREDAAPWNSGIFQGFFSQFSEEDSFQVGVEEDPGGIQLLPDGAEFREFRIHLLQVLPGAAVSLQWDHFPCKNPGFSPKSGNFPQGIFPIFFPSCLSSSLEKSGPFSQ